MKVSKQITNPTSIQHLRETLTLDSLPQTSACGACGGMCKSLRHMRWGLAHRKGHERFKANHETDIQTTSARNPNSGLIAETSACGACGGMCKSQRQMRWGLAHRKGHERYKANHKNAIQTT